MNKKSTLIILLMLLTLSGYSQENAAQKFKKLDWLVGKWDRTNNRPGQSGIESWTRVSATKLTGKGVTLKGTDTLFVEKLQLEIKGNDVFYVVKTSDNKETVNFKLTGITATSFICENPEHDFPKKIAYNLVDGKIKATISGNGKSIDYNFTKTK